MTTSAVSGYSPSALAYLGSAYANTASASNATAASGTSTQSASASDTVTLSDAALALLAAQSGQKDFAAITDDARTTLDDLYKAAKVTMPLAGGQATIDLTTLDRRTIFAIASNSGGKFTPDEQKVASQELLRRFDTAMGAPAAAAKLIGDYSTLYKAGLAYFDSMSAEEKATDSWAKQYAAMKTGLLMAQQDPTKVPQGIPDDPIANFVLQGPSTQTPATSFGNVAQNARLVLDQQYDAAKKSGTEVVFDSRRRNGQLMDMSGLDNRALSAVSLNQGKMFSTDETRMAKQLLDQRTRSSMLQAFQQGSKNGDPLGFSLGIVQQYQSMSAEERTAMNWSPDFLNMAVRNYKSTSSLLSMMQQSLGSSNSGILGVLGG
ncbi:MAG: hypothetical protein AB1490_15635 [Pseudomonadota bacterium]